MPNGDKNFDGFLAFEFRTSDDVTWNEIYLVSSYVTIKESLYIIVQIVSSICSCKTAGWRHIFRLPYFLALPL